MYNKIPGIGPDIEQAIAHTIKLTVSHNFLQIALFIGCCIALGLLIVKPSRRYTFLLIGCGSLLFYLTYIKHILEPFKAQTLTTLTTDTPRFIFVWLMNGTISKGIPIMSLIVGWGSLIIFVLLATNTFPKKLMHLRIFSRLSQKTNHEEKTQ